MVYKIIILNFSFNPLNFLIYHEIPIKLIKNNKYLNYKLGITKIPYSVMEY